MKEILNNYYYYTRQHFSYQDVMEHYSPVRAQKRYWCTERN